MSTLETAFNNLETLLESEQVNLQTVIEATNEIVMAGRDADNDSRNQTLQQLEPIIEGTHPLIAAFVAVAGGALVEFGGKPDILLETILNRIETMLPRAYQFAHVCAERQLKLDQQETLVELSQEYPAEVNSWQALNHIYLAAVAMLSTSPEARDAGRSRQALMDGTRALFQISEGATWLYKILRVMDGESLIVLHPAYKRGYRITIRGIADNFQLHTLLADALIGEEADGWIPLEERPDPQVVQIMQGEGQDTSLKARGFFNLYNWFAIEPDGTLHPERARQRKAWVWGEGIPADIARFEDTERIIVLGPPLYKRTWNATRLFNSMKASLTVDEKLAETAVIDYLNRLQVASPSTESLQQTSDE